MAIRFFKCFYFFVGGFAILNAQEIYKPQPVKLPNGWSLSPAGTALNLSSDLPLNMAIDPTGKYMAITDNGNGRQGIELIDLKNKRLIQFLELHEAWLGLQFTHDGKFLYCSAGNENRIIKCKVDNNQLVIVDSISLGIPWPNKIGVTGLSLNEKNNELFAVTKENNSLYICNTKTGKITAKLPLGSEAYTCLFNAKKSLLYITLWGAEKVLIYDVNKKVLTDSISVGSHPNDMILSSNSRYLYVANANSNSVSVINTDSKKVIETLGAALFPGSLTGSTTNSLALSSDNKTLYVANADNNCLAVFDVSQPGTARSKGFIPTGWYPTAVRINNNSILVANGKGFKSIANPNGPQPVNKKLETPYQKAISSADKKDIQYIGSLFKGSLSFIPVPDENQLSSYSQQVYKNSPYNINQDSIAMGELGNPIPQKVGDSSVIKYVFYIIKENRTYDQVLGDVKEGNGDTALCLFNEKITPNLHALTKEFALFDNFYVDAEVSADGHNWSTAAYATDYVEKTWPTNYSNRGGTYDYEGTRQVAYPEKGFIWDYCKRAGISYRTYGEFVHDGKDPILPSIKGHYCPGFPDFDLGIQDIYREKIWEHDFDSLLSVGQVPRFSSLRFSNDHTSGLRKGAYTPFAAVADNDLAVGRFIEHLSKSVIWKESVVFVLEDDAQNGPDHVDAHRSPVYVISPYIKRHCVDHTMYSTTGVLRTIELILGLPPMSQYDAAATPLFKAFTAKADTTVYEAKMESIDLNERNSVTNTLSKASAKLDLSKEDAAPDVLFNEIIWKAVKGEDAVMPAPRHSAFLKVSAPKDDDD